MKYAIVLLLISVCVMMSSATPVAQHHGHGGYGHGHGGGHGGGYGGHHGGHGGGHHGGHHGGYGGHGRHYRDVDHKGHEHGPGHHSDESHSSEETHTGQPSLIKPAHS